MRIAIIAPPRCGNHWLKCLLARLYELRSIGGDAKPAPRGGAGVASLPVGAVPDGTIFHLHCDYRPRLARHLRTTPAELVTITRDPYDAFVSYYRWVQGRRDQVLAHARELGRPIEEPALEAKFARPRHALVGRELDDPAVLSYIATSHRALIERSVAWVESGMAHVVRYEDLHADATATLRALARQLPPVAPGRLVAAVDACQIDTMRLAKPHTVKTGRVGDSWAALPPEAVEVFRDTCADAITRLGYPVR